MKPLIIAAMATALTACASSHEIATGPDAYWINSVPPDVAKLEEERQRTAFYNQPAMKVYLTVARALPVVIFGVALAAPTYVPPVVP